MNSDIRNKSTSITHALRALLLFRDRDLVRVSELAAELKVARSTAHRVLTTLQAHGFAIQARHRGGYRPGPQLIEIGFAALRGLDVRRAARPHLEELSQQLGETVHLVALEGNQCRFLDSVESMATVRVSSRAGWLLPAHGTSGGKVLLAALSRDARDRLYPEGELPGMTARTTTTREALESELEVVAARGYGTNFEESEVGLSAVAVLVRDPEGSPLAAISVSAPASRLSEERVLQYVEAARQAAARVELQLRRRPAG